MDNLFFSSAVILLILLALSGFLNYLSALYSEADLFKIDWTKKRKQNKLKKLNFILKNSSLFFAIICFIQVPLNLFISNILVDHVGREFINEAKVNINIFILCSGILVALFTEILARYLASRKNSKRWIFNNFLIGITYSIIRPFSFLQKIVRPKKKIFSNSEKDIIRFVNNLTVEKVLEKKEARLIQSALNFDDLNVSFVHTPWKKVIFLKENMTYKEIQDIHSKHFFTRYPVLNEKKEVIGIFNMEVFYWKLIKNKNANWTDYIDKKIIYFSPRTKLDKVLEKLQSTNCRLALIRQSKKNFGIITLQDILGALVGKIKDERDILLLPRRLD